MVKNKQNVPTKRRQVMDTKNNQKLREKYNVCLLYTSDAADER